MVISDVVIYAFIITVFSLTIFVTSRVQ